MHQRMDDNDVCRVALSSRYPVFAVVSCHHQAHFNPVSSDTIQAFTSYSTVSGGGNSVEENSAAIHILKANPSSRRVGCQGGKGIRPQVPDGGLSLTGSNYVISRTARVMKGHFPLQLQVFHTRCSSTSYVKSSNTSRPRYQ